MMLRLVPIITIYIGTAICSLAQDFDYQINKQGKAYYQDSVIILDQSPDSILNKATIWLKNQIDDPGDTLVLSNSGANLVSLIKKMKFPNSENIAGNLNFTATISISIRAQTVVYTLDKIFLVDRNDPALFCNNLGDNHGRCLLEGRDREWNEIRKYVNRRLINIAKAIEEMVMGN